MEGVPVRLADGVGTENEHPLAERLREGAPENIGDVLWYADPAEQQFVGERLPRFDVDPSPPEPVPLVPVPDSIP